jgi:hypothetical protein
MCTEATLSFMNDSLLFELPLLYPSYVDNGLSDARLASAPTKQSTVGNLNEFTMYALKSYMLNYPLRLLGQHPTH